MKAVHCFKTYLIDKKRSHKFSWLEHLHHLPDQIIVRCLGKVGFEADVGELWLRGDVDGPVSSLEKQAKLRYRNVSVITMAEVASSSKKKNTHVSLHAIH